MLPRSTSQFVGIQLVIFVTNFQSTLLNILAQTGVMKPKPAWGFEDEFAFATMLQVNKFSEYVLQGSWVRIPPEKYSCDFFLIFLFTGLGKELSKQCLHTVREIFKVNKSEHGIIGLFFQETFNRIRDDSLCDR